MKLFFTITPSYQPTSSMSDAKAIHDAGLSEPKNYKNKELKPNFS